MRTTVGCSLGRYFFAFNIRWEWDYPSIKKSIIFVFLDHVKTTDTKNYAQMVWIISNFYTRTQKALAIITNTRFEHNRKTDPLSTHINDINAKAKLLDSRGMESDMEIYFKISILEIPTMRNNTVQLWPPNCYLPSSYVPSLIILLHLRRKLRWKLSIFTISFHILWFTYYIRIQLISWFCAGRPLWFDKVWIRCEASKK